MELAECCCFNTWGYYKSNWITTTQIKFSVFGERGKPEYLHCTSTTVTLESLEHRLLASHLYSPAAFLLTFRKNNLLPLNRFPPTTLTHETEGNGWPDTWQNEVKFCPSDKVLFSTALIVAGSVKNIKNYFIPKCSLSKLHQHFISGLVITCFLNTMMCTRSH